MFDRHSLLSATAGLHGADIAIIGKGASIDQIELDALDGMIVINANDSEVIFPGQIGVFHHGWVLDRFEHQSPKCRLYVTDREMPFQVPVLKARYAAGQTEPELFIDRFFDKENLWLEQAVVISCLRVAHELAQAIGTSKRVFLLGFDFSLENGFSTLIENGLHGSDDAYVDSLVRSQERYMERLLGEQGRLAIGVYHVGTKPYSLYTVEAFNALRKFNGHGASICEQAPTVQVQNPVLVVAEITTNHFGDKDRLAAMIRLAKQAGADFVKLQKRDVETFYSQDTLAKPFKSPFGSTFRDYRHGLELGTSDFEWVDALCKSIGIGWFASVLDEASFNFMVELGCRLIKLPSTISERKSFLERVGSIWTGELVISTGMTGPEYEMFIRKSFSRASRIYLLQCTSAYPTPERDAGVGVVRRYRDLAKADARIVPGYSSHDIGSLCSQLAVAAGARMLEKHVKLGAVQWAHFDEVALDLATGEFASYVRDVRRAQMIAYDEEKQIFSSEHHKY